MLKSNRSLLILALVALVNMLGYGIIILPLPFLVGAGLTLLCYWLARRPITIDKDSPSIVYRTSEH